MNFLIQHLQNYQASDIKICTLLFKESAVQYNIHPHYYGFKVENFFVAGYGLDDKGKSRNQPFISAI